MTFKKWVKWKILRNFKKLWMFLFGFLSHPSEGEILVSCKTILIQGAAVIVSALDRHQSVDMENVWQVCYNA